jgi:hypothetical protein
MRKRVMRDLRTIQDFLADEEERRGTSSLPRSHRYRREVELAIRALARVMKAEEKGKR